MPNFQNKAAGLRLERYRDVLAHFGSLEFQAAPAKKPPFNYSHIYFFI
jgi:hypothetical protein